MGYATRRSLAAGESAPLIEPESLEIKPELTLAIKPTSKPASSRAKNTARPVPRARTRSLSPKKKVNGATIVQTGGHSDEHEVYEFGGPTGTLALMIGFPLLLYYFWICLVVYDGKLTAPASLQDTPHWFAQMARHVYLGAFPTLPAVSLYGGFVAFQLFLAWVVPGYEQEGLPISSLGGKRLMYNCNALGAWYITLVTTAALHFSGLLRLPILIDRLGEIMTVAQIAGFGLAAVCYYTAVSKKTAIRMSGNFIYDYFMGAALNPRFGPVDIKMFAEVRIPWILMFLLSLAGAAKQYDDYGYVSPNQAHMVLGTYLMINACANKEQLIPQTWDMAYEKFGWLVRSRFAMSRRGLYATQLSYWNLAGVPFTYCYSIVYMATHDPGTYRFPTWAYPLLYGTLLTAYTIWDQAMAQKSNFKMEQAGNYKPRKYTFPVLPWSFIPNAKYLQTSRGKLLIDGWWAYLRKPNYSADFIQMLTWGLCAGFGSILPYWYPFFFIVMLVHRCSRDFDRCARKYGKDWERYCEIVPYRFIPGVY